MQCQSYWIRKTDDAQFDKLQKEKKKGKIKQIGRKKKRSTHEQNERMGRKSSDASGDATGHAIGDEMTAWSLIPGMILSLIHI